jgi:beta-mannosidase
MKRLYLIDDWQFCLVDGSGTGDIKKDTWYKADIPGTIYHNLINRSFIPDPFFADNELSLQWIAESDWAYRSNFKYPGNFNKAKPVHLIFEGLDSIAEIILNGKRIGYSDNMFRRWEFDISKLLKEENTLRINFTSPYKYAKQQEEKFGKLPVALNSERVYIRKAQYSFGWDWGPSFADIGIWKPVYIVQKEKYFIRDITFHTLKISKPTALAELIINLNKAPSGDCQIIVSLSDGLRSYDFKLKGKSQRIKEVLKIPHPKIWWPNGEGEQNLYTLKVSIVNKEEVFDEVTRKVGIRTVELRLKYKGKNTFHFLVNGRRIFAKGANWIPADSFLTRTDNNKYQELLTLAKYAGMNFIRVWGGGIYEQDIFYDLCDQLGLLVWQDFMFACAAYPENKMFLENVAAEIEENIIRLQHHPSISIWCGNNENEWIWYQGKKSFKTMPGYKIYSKLIPEILKRTDPHRIYWESSPFGNEDDPNSPLSGNRHQWDIWSNWRDYTTVESDSSLFVTEFGFQGPANQSTLEKVIPDKERNSQGYLFEFHNKQVEGNERMFRFLSGHLPVRTTWKDFIYLTQLNQGVALKTCIEQWRFNYPHTNGSIIWQLNDCWPVTSWALIDSDLKPKLSYFLVKNAFQHQFIKFTSDSDQINIYLLNDDTNGFKGYYEIAEVDLNISKVKSKRNKIKTNKERTRINTIKLSDNIKSGRSIVMASLFDENNELIHRNYFSAQTWKYLILPRAEITASVTSRNNKYYIQVKSDKPGFFVTIYSDEVKLDYNGFHILPGEELFIPVTLNSLPEKIKLNIFALNDYYHD